MTQADETTVVIWSIWVIVWLAGAIVLIGAVVCLYADGVRSGLNLTNRPRCGRISDTTDQW